MRAAPLTTPPYSAAYNAPQPAGHWHRRPEIPPPWHNGTPKSSADSSTEIFPGRSLRSRCVPNLLANSRAPQIGSSIHAPLRAKIAATDAAWKTRHALGWSSRWQRPRVLAQFAFRFPSRPRGWWGTCCGTPLKVRLGIIRSAKNSMNGWSPEERAHLRLTEPSLESLYKSSMVCWKIKLYSIPP